MLAYDKGATFVLTGLAEGFRLVDSPETIPSAECRNFSSALDQPNKSSWTLFREELEMGRITRQDSELFAYMRSGRYPKKEETGCAL